MSEILQISVRRRVNSSVRPSRLSRLFRISAVSFEAPVVSQPASAAYLVRMILYLHLTSSFSLELLLQVDNFFFLFYSYLYSARYKFT